MKLLLLVQKVCDGFMDNTYHRAPSEKQQPPGYHGGYLETPYTAHRPPPSSADHEQPDHTAARWASSQGYDGHPYGFRCDFPAPSPGGGGFGGPHLALPYGFDPSVPPPPFGCPPPGHFPNMVPSAPVNTYSSRGASFDAFSPQFRPGPQAARYDSGQRQQHEYEGLSESGAHDRSPGPATRAEDETAIQRRQDQQWLRRFLQSRDTPSKTPQTPQTQQPQHSCVPDLREALYRAAQLVSQLAQSCETLKDNVEDESVWTDSYLTALNVKRELQDQLPVLSDSPGLERWKAKLSRVAKRRARRLRARKGWQMEEKEREDRISEKEAGIDKWRMQQIHQVEEKKKVSSSATFVLCVCFKQSDHLIKLFLWLLRTPSRQSPDEYLSFSSGLVSTSSTGNFLTH